MREFSLNPNWITVRTSESSAMFFKIIIIYLFFHQVHCLFRFGLETTIPRFAEQL